MKKFVIICALLVASFITQTAFAQSAPEAAPVVTQLPSGDSMVNPIDQAPSNLPDGAMERAYPIAPTPDTRLCQGSDGKLCGDQPDMSWLGAGVMNVLFVVALIALTGFIFWLWMFIHAIKHPINNKAVWIICFILFGFLTAIVYYFVIKRSFVSATPPAGAPPTPVI